MNSYPNIETFYSENEARRRSGEADYGVWWMGEHDLGPWRVSYVQATGEIYAIRLGGGGQVQVLGIVPPDPDEIYYTTLDHILEDWSEHCGKRGSLEWVRSKLAGYRRSEP